MSRILGSLRCCKWTLKALTRNWPPGRTMRWLSPRKRLRNPAPVAVCAAAECSERAQRRAAQIRGGPFGERGRSRPIEPLEGLLRVEISTVGRPRGLRIRGRYSIFPTPLYTPRFVFNRGSRTNEGRRPRGGRSDRCDLRSRRVRGPTDPEDPEDAPVRPLVRLRLAPPRLLLDPPLGRSLRLLTRSRPPPRSDIASCSASVRRTRVSMSPMARTRSSASSRTWGPRAPTSVG